MTPMLIVLGGFYGSGRKIFAKKLAARHQFHLYDMEAVRSRSFRFTNAGVREATRWERSDMERGHLYRKVLETFPIVSKTYPDTIVEDGFHRRKLREFFLKGAAEYFKPVVFVWIDSDESHVEERLRRMKRSRIAGSVEEGIRRRRGAARTFDGLAPETRVFKCVRADDAEVAALWTLIEREAGRGI